MMNLTVAQLAKLLSELPMDIQDYEVWIEADPSSPVCEVSYIDHEGRRIFL
jgi:hypothetical protein